MTKIERLEIEEVNPFIEALSDDLMRVWDKCSKNGYSKLDVITLGLMEALEEIEMGEANDRGEL